MCLEDKSGNEIEFQITWKDTCGSTLLATEILCLTGSNPSVVREQVAQFLQSREREIAEHSGETSIQEPDETPCTDHGVDEDTGVTSALFQNLQSFESVYRGKDLHPVRIGAEVEWSSSVRGMRGWGFELRLTTSQGRKISAFVEPRNADRPCFKTTRWLNVSYNVHESNLEEREAEQATTLLAAHFAARESEDSRDALLALVSSSTASSGTPSERGPSVPAEGTEAREQASSCNLDLFKQLYFGKSVPERLDEEILLLDVWVDENQRCIVTRIEIPGAGYVDIALEERDAHKTEIRSGFLSLIHRQLTRPIAPEKVDALMERYATILCQREENFSIEELHRVYVRTAGRSGSGSQTVGDRGHREKCIELRINRDCNEECLFCNTPPDFDRIIESRDKVMDAIRTYSEKGYTEVALTGREPTLDPNLVEYIRLASEVGYEIIGIQTNATTLSNPDVLARYIAAGLTSVQISLHTFNHDTFSSLVGKRELLDRTLEGMDNIMSYPDLYCCVLFVITRQNIEEMESFVTQIAERYGSGVDLAIFSPMAPLGWGAHRTDLIPRLSDLKTHINRAFTKARELGVKTWIPARCGLPLCGTPESFWESNELSEGRPEDVQEQNKSKPPSCTACRFFSSCPGVWDGYIDAYGTEDIVPINHGQVH
jgi:sulfatase maturation enzyme AslB (radical SAM superfamily)